MPASPDTLVRLAKYGVVRAAERLYSTPRVPYTLLVKVCRQATLVLNPSVLLVSTKLKRLGFWPEVRWKAKVPFREFFELIILLRRVCMASELDWQTNAPCY